MLFKIITNNLKVYELCKSGNLNVSYMAGHAKDVIKKCLELIYEGWQLAADPLAGYLSRPNPYHTMFLRESASREIQGEDLLRLQRTLEQWERYDHVLPMTERLWKDYEELDFALSTSTLEGILKYHFY